jgi:hypothetical protein
MNQPEFRDSQPGIMREPCRQQILAILAEKTKELHAQFL